MIHRSILPPGAPVQTPALALIIDLPIRALTKALARRRRRPYYSHVPDKEGNGFDSLNTQSALTAPSGFFTCVRLRSSSMGGGGGEAFGLAGFFECQSVNPAICRSPRLTAGRGLTATQRGLHHA